MLQKSIETGEAFDRFVQMAVSLGANKDILEDYENKLPKAKYIAPIYADKEGYVSQIDTRSVGLGVIMLGGGRVNPDQQINYTTGFTSFCQKGDMVDAKTPLCFIHAEDENKINEVSQMIRQAIVIKEDQISPTPVIIEKIS